MIVQIRTDHLYDVARDILHRLKEQIEDNNPSIRIQFETPDVDALVRLLEEYLNK